MTAVLIVALVVAAGGLVIALSARSARWRERRIEELARDVAAARSVTLDEAIELFGRARPLSGDVGFTEE